MLRDKIVRTRTEVEDRAILVGAARISRAVEVSVRRLNERFRVAAVATARLKTKGVHSVQRARIRDFEDRAMLVGAAIVSRAVEVPIRALNDSGLWGPAIWTTCSSAGAKAVK